MHEDRPEDPYIQYLREGLAQPGKSQTGLARHLGIDPSAVNKVLHNKRKLTSAELTKAAAYLGAPAPNNEVQVSPRGIVPARVVGKVQAGAFLEIDDTDQSEPITVYLPADDRYPNARVLVFDVAGDSMNALEPRPILEGDQVIGLAFEDVERFTGIQDKMVVVVERAANGGQLREWSVKQIELYPDRVEFHPRSTNKRHKPIVVPLDFQADDGTTVQIVALMRSTQSRLPQF